MDAKTVVLSNGWRLEKGDKIVLRGRDFRHIQAVKKKDNDILFDSLACTIKRIEKPQTGTHFPVRLILEDNYGRDIKCDIEKAVRANEVAVPLPRIETEYDKFNKSWRIQTAAIDISASPAPLEISMRAIDTRHFLQIESGWWAVGDVDTSDPMIFLLDNEDVVKIYPTAMQSANVVNARLAGATQDYRHEYRISMEQMAMIGNHPVKSIRRHFGSFYEDYDLEGRHGERLSAFITAFTAATLNPR